MKPIRQEITISIRLHMVGSNSKTALFETILNTVDRAGFASEAEVLSASNRLIRDAATAFESEDPWDMVEVVFSATLELDLGTHVFPKVGNHVGGEVVFEGLESEKIERVKVGVSLFRMRFEEGLQALRAVRSPSQHTEDAP